MMLKGKNIYLREIKLSDVTEKYCRWLNDPEVNQFLESRFEKWTIKKLKEYITKVKKDPNCRFLAIISEDNDVHIGNIKFAAINRVHKFAEIGIVIGEKSFWGRGLGTEAIKLASRYAFGKLRLHKLICGAYENNISSIKMFTKAGFVKEGAWKNAYHYKGRYIDLVLLGLVKK